MVSFPGQMSPIRYDPFSSPDGMNSQMAMGQPGIGSGMCAFPRSHNTQARADARAHTCVHAAQ
eukprot:6181244-Pleurochrysis_carterae.AAC.2